MFAIRGRRERRDAHDGGAIGQLRDQRLGEVAQAEEIDGHDEQRVTDARGDPGDVEQRVDVVADGRDGRIDGRRVGEVNLVEVVDLERGTTFVEPDDVRPEFGELAHHVFADA